MYIVQSVLNHLKNINPIIKTFVLSLILSRNRKNCAAIAHSIDVSKKRLYQFFENSTTYLKEIEEALLELAKETRKTGTIRAFVVDPTSIIKHYAEKMEKICHDRTGCTKKVEKVLVPVYAAVIDQYVTIPLTLDFWVQEKIVGTKKYKSKIAIAQQLILWAKKHNVDFDFTTLDGAFSKEPMFSFFKQNQEIKFSMRIAKSRVVITEDGVSAQLKNHPALKLYRNEREKTIQAKLNKDVTTYFFTAHKRKKRDGGSEVVV